MLILSLLCEMVFLQSLQFLTFRCLFKSYLMTLRVLLWYKLNSADWIHFWKILWCQHSALNPWTACSNSGKFAFVLFLLKVKIHSAGGTKSFRTAVHYTLMGGESKAVHNAVIVGYILVCMCQQQQQCSVDAFQKWQGASRC